MFAVENKKSSDEMESLELELQKMKSEAPQELTNLINENIINISHPQKVKPKPRAPRGSRKRREQQHLSKNDIDRLLALARQAGDKDMIRKLTPKKDLRSAKRELISSCCVGSRLRSNATAFESFVGVCECTCGAKASISSTMLNPRCLLICDLQ